MENVIVFCDNMRSLQFHFKRRSLIQLCFSPEALERLNITRGKLETFYFGSSSDQWSLKAHENLDVQKWMRIFRNLNRIYPNVIHHGVTFLKQELGSNRDVIFRFSNVPNETDQQTLTEIMAFSLPNKNENQGKKTIEALSKLRYDYNLLLLY